MNGSLRTAYLKALDECEAANAADIAAVIAWEGDEAVDMAHPLYLAMVAASDSAKIAEAKLEAARQALHDSEENEQWTIYFPDGPSWVLGVMGIFEAREAAEAAIREGDYGKIASTIWVDARIGSETDHEETLTAQIDPEEPDCADGKEHDWQSPHEIVGGLKENPGVWGHGGGVKINECCMNCGAGKFTDTWAQRPDTGEQGLISIRYEEGTYKLEE